ncbi:reverse transcriptase [Lasius niger]|uniref:Reverse transcriptase n=1 Tax=Lasius niger TaxID=67767 RepID=A0A0J7KIY3_LASNI|nr:reverse transcriptase [Lasius niger]
MSLCRLLPNLGGPEGSVRRLYAGTVHSMLLYGAPVWAEKLDATRRAKNAMHQLQRRVANRICRGYRTRAGVPVTDGVRRALRVHTRRALIREWNKRLDPRLPGQRTVGAIQPCLEEWLDRAGGGVNYDMTQVLTGHGCFGEYLGRIQKKRTTRCHHCSHERDTAQHTLEECVAWAGERTELVAVVGRDLSLPAVIRAVTGNDDGWKAFSSFCSKVMLQKEEAEKERERTGQRQREMEQDTDGGVPPWPLGREHACGGGRRGASPQQIWIRGRRGGDGDT